MVLKGNNQNYSNVTSSHKKRLLISARPFVDMKNRFYLHPVINQFEVTWMYSAQQLTEEELLEMLPSYDGWILGDDPCSRRVLQAGKSGALKAVVKWGVGTDNVDFAALTDLNIDFNNTPGVFGKEVADLAVAVKA